MKPTICAILLFLAASQGLAYPSETQTKGLPPEPDSFPSMPLTKGLPPPPPDEPATKGLPPPPPDEPATTGLPPPPPDESETKGLPPPPPDEPATKGLPPPPSDEPETKGLPPPPSSDEPATKGLPPPEPATKGLPPPGTQTKGLPTSILDVLPQAALTGISTKCTTALLNVLTNPEFLKCIPLTALLPIAPILLDPSVIQNFLKDPKKFYSTIQKPFIQFSDGICAAPKCSDKLIESIVQGVTSNCKDELDKKDPLIVAIFDVFTLYSPLHDSICFKDKKGTYCWDESITVAIGLPKAPFKIVDGGIIDAVAVADPPAVCTPCNRAVVNTFGNFLQKNPKAGDVFESLGVKLDAVKIGVAVKCGLSFENGDVGDPGKS